MEQGNSPENLGHSIVETHNFSLELTAESGQAFRWRKAGDGTWRVPAFGDVARFSQNGDELSVECGLGHLADWLRYLRLDDESARLHERALAVLRDLPDPMPEIVARYGGLRVLAQEPWETAASFVISQNNNIKRIERIVERLCGGPEKPFPGPGELRALLEEDGFGMGYRRPYLVDLCERWPELGSALGRDGYEADRERLMQVRGIGPKVANCICLYGLGYLQVVPVDTWIAKAQREFGIVWHPEFGGLQQQMVFEWMRGR